MFTSHEAADGADPRRDVRELDPERSASTDDAPEIELDLTLDCEDAYCAAD